jgi:hypothetical protein
MNVLEFEGEFALRPAQDTFKLKQTIGRQKQTIEELQDKLEKYRAMVEDAGKTILTLEQKVQRAEQKLLQMAAKK